MQETQKFNVPLQPRIGPPVQPTHLDIRFDPITNLYCIVVQKNGITYSGTADGIEEAYNTLGRFVNLANQGKL